MWIERQRFQRLRKCGVLRNEDGQEKEGGMVVSPTCVEQIVSGKIVARLLCEKHSKSRSGVYDTNSSETREKEYELLSQLASSSFVQRGLGVVAFDR